MTDVLGSGAHHGVTEKQQLRAELNMMRALVCLLVKRGVQGADPNAWATQITASEFATLNGRSWNVAVEQDANGGTLVKVSGQPQPRSVPKPQPSALVTP